MNKNIKIVAIILIGIIALYIFKINSDYNLNKAIEACLVAQKKTSESFNIKQAKKFCEEEIRKKISSLK